MPSQKPLGSNWRRQDAIQRLMRMRMARRGKVVARMVMRFVIPMRERRRQKALISAFSEILKQTSKSRHHGFESSAVIFNAALFFLIAERDIQTVKTDALTHPDPWRRSLCSRVIILTIHELNLDKVAGQKLRQALIDAGVSEEAKKRATEALRALRTVQGKLQKQFTFLRNATIAHRDPDALAQYYSITQIDEMVVLRSVTEFYKAADTLIGVVSELILQSSMVPGLYRQLKISAKRKRN